MTNRATTPNKQKAPPYEGAGSTEGSSYRQQPDNKEQYGSKKSSYWQEKGSDRKQSVGSRMNEESLKQKR